MDSTLLTGGCIKKLRIERGLSQTELARLASVSQAHVAKIESGKVDPRLSTVNKILLVLSKKESISKRCRDIMSRVMSAGMETPVNKIIAIMRSSGFSQMPVLEKGRQVGSISEETLLHNMGRKLEKLRARDIMDRPFPIIDCNDTVEMVPPLLDTHSAILVSEKGKIVGIITKSDLLGMK